MAEKITPQGYVYGEEPKSKHPFWADNQSGGTGEKGDKGDPGPQGPQGEKGDKGDPGDSVSKAGLVNDVSMTNEDGVYTFKQTKYAADGTTTEETEIGTVEVPKQENSIVEMKDSVVTNAEDGYDFHTLTETQTDGTENEVGKFYLAENQITGITQTEDKKQLTIDKVGQDGTKTSESFEFPGSKVTVTPTLTDGAEIATIDVDGESKTLYGNKPTSVQYRSNYRRPDITQSSIAHTSPIGVLGTLTVDDDVTSLYGPALLVNELPCNYIDFITVNGSATIENGTDKSGTSTPTKTFSCTRERDCISLNISSSYMRVVKPYSDTLYYDGYICIAVPDTAQFNITSDVLLKLTGDDDDHKTNTKGLLVFEALRFNVRREDSVSNGITNYTYEVSITKDTIIDISYNKMGW